METEQAASAAAPADEVRALVAALLPSLAPHAMLDADNGLLVLPVGAAHADISLDAITAVCAGLPRAAWPGRVEAWLAAKAAQVTAALAERERLGVLEERLRVQVTPRVAEEERGELMCTPYGDEGVLDMVIVLDGRGRLTRQRSGQLVIHDPGSHALANTLRDELPSFTVTDDPDTGVRTVSKPGSPYVTSVLPALQRFLPPGPCPYGVLVALPRYSEVLLTPVVPGGLDEAARLMQERARLGFCVAEDPCDDRVFWWADEKLYAVGFGRFSGRVKVPGALRGLVRGKAVASGPSARTP
jgi:hypothetical protein